MFSLLVRRFKKSSAAKKTIHKLQDYVSAQNKLSLYQSVPNKLLIIRLDEIGDYILWRNSLHWFKTSLQWKHHHITLLGNLAWKSIFDYADTTAVDATIWVDKKEYFKNEDYRFEIWKQLRNEGFETVICPSKTRTILLDDACVLATGACNTIAAENAFIETQTNQVVNNLYKHIYPDSKIYHDFFFNQDFSNWCCHTSHHLERPQINSPLFRQLNKNYIICYIGASKKSRRIPTATWIELIKLLKQHYQKKIILAGGLAEKIISEQIAAVTEVENITGRVSLAEMIDYTAFADAVITGDTMQAHLAASCNIPMVIIANGNTFARFSEYKTAGISGVETVYAKPFLRAWKKKNYALFSDYIATTDDITTIDAKDILQALQKVKPDL